jgi:hypothetical protein
LSTPARCGAIGLLVLAVAALVPVPGLPQTARVEKRPSRERRVDASRESAQQEQRVRRARGLLRRLLRDPRTSPEMKQQAGDLEKLLDRRNMLRATLAERYKEFVARHAAEIDELQDLHRRAQGIEERLTAARRELLQASADDIKALKEGSARAAELADALRAAQAQARRERRRR